MGMEYQVKMIDKFPYLINKVPKTATIYNTEETVEDLFLKNAHHLNHAEQLEQIMTNKNVYNVAT